MHWNTHDRLSGMMMPRVSPKVIYRVNRAMDNPDPWSIYLSRYMKKSGHTHAFDVPGLRKYGHREANHNWMSAMMTDTCMEEGRGMYAAVAANHIMQDLMSDMLIHVQWGMRVGISMSRC
jgi:hypothetical protein